MRQVVGLLARPAAQWQGLPVGRGGQPGAALVQEQHPEFLHRPPQPGLRTGEAPGPEAGSPLQIEQPRQFLAGPGGGHHLAAEHLDLLTAGVGVVERHGEVTVGEDEAGLTVAVQEGSRIDGSRTVQHIAVPRTVPARLRRPRPAPTVHS